MRALVGDAIAAGRPGADDPSAAEYQRLERLLTMLRELVAELGPAWLERRAATLDDAIARFGLREFEGGDAKERMALRFVGDALRELAAIVAEFDIAFESLTERERSELFATLGEPEDVASSVRDRHAMTLLRLELAIAVCSDLTFPAIGASGDTLYEWGRHAAATARRARASIRPQLGQIRTEIVHAQARNAWHDWTDEDIAYELRENPFGDRGH